MRDEISKIIQHVKTFLCNANFQDGDSLKIFKDCKRLYTSKLYQICIYPCILHNEELNDLYSSPNIVLLIK